MSADASTLLYFLTGLTSGLLLGLAAGLALYPQTQRLRQQGGVVGPWITRQSQAQAALESLRRYG